MHSEGSRCLPPELLWPIAEHVTKADRIQCALVCKAWRPIFQAKLHEDLYFTRKRHLIKHLANIKHSVNDNDDTATMATSTTLGQLTQKLYLDERIRLTRRDMVYLADMMPNLRSLQFNPLLWSELGYHPAFKRWQKLRQLPRLTDEAAAVAMMDDMGHRLVELSISFPLAVELHKKGKLLPLLEQTPRVKTFSMDINELEMDAENELCLTLDNFLAIFRAMPQLVVFSSHEFKLLDISREDKVYDIQPTKVQSLTLGCAFKDIRWTTVISKLFPKAQSVTLGIRLLTDQERQQQEEQQPQSTATDDAVSQQDDSYNREMLLNMIISFKDMRSLVLDGFCAEITRILTAEHLTTALKLAGRQLQNLNYFAYQEIYDHRSPWQYLDVMDPQTQELSISTKIRRVPLYDFLNPLSQHFHRLTHLNLYMAYPRTIVNVPMTLSLFPSLDTLHLWNCTLESRDEDRGGELLTGHPLQNLTLKLVDILNPCLWDVFARSCPKLSNVTLGTCTVHLEHDNIPFSMHFNFPHHTLDTVEIYTLNFFRRYRPISNLGRGPARLLSVVSHAKIEHTIARRQRANVDTTCGGIEEERWYHQYRDDSDYVNESKGLRVKRLSSYSGDEIRAFCSNIEAQLLFFDPMPYDSAAPFSKNEWWRALPNGYVNISSRSVRKIIFNHVHISYK